MNLVILFGGGSVEHDVSIITYYQVLQAIDIKKYNVYPVYITKENQFVIFNGIKELESFKDLKKEKFKEVNFIKKGRKVYLKRFMYNVKVDVVMNLTHGKDLEDGTLSGFLKMLNVPFTSPKVISSAVYHHKYYTKLILNKENIKTCEAIYLTESMWMTNREVVIKKIKNFKKRIVKPCSLGSSIGINVSTEISDTIEHINYAFNFDNELIIENCLNKYLELNQAFYKVKDNINISKIEEVKNDSSIYTFEKKYENGNITRVIPARINNGLRNKVTKTTKKIANLFNSNGVVRVDYLYDLEEEKLYVNEVNIIPGALAYYLFEAKDIYFNDLINDLINEAFYEKSFEDQKINSFDSNILFSKNSKMK